MVDSTTQSGWREYGIWFAFQFVRQMRSRIHERDERIKNLETDLLEWQNRTLSLAHIRPLHQQSNPPGQPMFRAPIGPTQKNSMLQAQQAEKDLIGKPTDADILNAANKVAGNGNGQQK